MIIYHSDFFDDEKRAAEMLLFFFLKIGDIKNYCLDWRDDT